MDGWARRHGRQAGGIHGVAAAELLGFWSAQFAFGGLAQGVQLFGFQLAHIARLLVEDQRAVAYAANLFNEVAYSLKHLAQFAVAALDEDNFIPGIVALANLADAGRRGANLGRSGFTALDGHAAAQNVQLALGGLAGDLDQVSFFNARGGFGEAVGQIAVVGDDEEALAHVV